VAKPLVFIGPNEVARLAQRPLRKTERNEVLHAIREIGLEPSEFAWKDMIGAWNSQAIKALLHPATGSYFLFDGGEGPQSQPIYYCVFFPGQGVPVTEKKVENWTVQLAVFRDWLIRVKEEAETPDLWAAIADQRHLSEAAVSEESNAPFTQQENEHLRAALLEIQEYVVAVTDAPEESRHFIEKRIQYLGDATDRLGRKDWLNLALGGIVSFFVTVGADNANEILAFAWQRISDALGIASEGIRLLIP
jgi:hypothetical protein